jgi:hypothetical protein
MKPLGNLSLDGRMIQLSLSNLLHSRPLWKKIQPLKEYKLLHHGGKLKEFRRVTLKFPLRLSSGAVVAINDISSEVSGVGVTLKLSPSLRRKGTVREFTEVLRR